MDVASLGAQGYTPMPAARTVEEYAEIAPVEAPVQVKAEPEKKANEGADKGLDTENLDDRQINDMLSKAVKEANKKLEVTSNELHYSYHKPTRSVSVKVINSDTKEVVREIPPQKSLDALAKVWELAGILVDEKK